MPRLIKDGAIAQDAWLAVDPLIESPGARQVCTLEQWLQRPDKHDSAVQLEADQPPAPLFDALDAITLVVINFTVFTDGRGFSYARELRERGYTGELRAAGNFIQDQMTYLQRVGFNAFQFSQDAQLEQTLSSLGQFTEFYQAAIDQPLPLYRRR